MPSNKEISEFVRQAISELSGSREAFHDDSFPIAYLGLKDAVFNILALQLNSYVQQNNPHALHVIAQDLTQSATIRDVIDLVSSRIDGTNNTGPKRY